LTLLVLPMLYGMAHRCREKANRKAPGAIAAA